MIPGRDQPGDARSVITVPFPPPSPPHAHARTGPFDAVRKRGQTTPSIICRHTFHCCAPLARSSLSSPHPEEVRDVGGALCEPGSHGGAIKRTTILLGYVPVYAIRGVCVLGGGDLYTCVDEWIDGWVYIYIYTCKGAWGWARRRRGVGSHPPTPYTHTASPRSAGYEKKAAPPLSPTHAAFKRQCSVLCCKSSPTISCADLKNASSGGDAAWISLTPSSTASE